MSTPDLIQWLGERLDRLDEKLDSLAATTVRVDTTLATHDKAIEALRADVGPLKAHTQQARGVAWFVGVLVAVVGLIATVRAMAG